MQSYTLQAKKRTSHGRKNYAMRAQGEIPAVVYGAIAEPISISVDRPTFVRLFKQAGESSIIELAVEGMSPLHVLIQDIQQDPLRNEAIHADFRAVDMTKKIEAEVKLRFVGESAAIKALGGTLVHPINAVRIRAFPKDLVPYIDVSIESLATFDDAIQIKDLVKSSDIELVGDPQQTVAFVAAPRSDEEMASLNAATVVDVTKVEVAKKKPAKEEGEEAAKDDKAGKAAPEAKAAAPKK